MLQCYPYADWLSCVDRVTVWLSRCILCCKAALPRLLIALGCCCLAVSDWIQPALAVFQVPLCWRHCIGFELEAACCECSMLGIGQSGHRVCYLPDPCCPMHV